MANKVTQKDIKQFNELYYRYKTYAEVARQTGFSASTVKKYIVPNYIPEAQIQLIKFTEDLIPELPTFYFKNCNNVGELCELSDNECDEIYELWAEVGL